MSKTIHLFRHGQTDWNLQRRMQGHTDISLNEEGRQQALQLQKYFEQNPVDLFASSDLRRAQETATIANAHLQKNILTFSGFREAHLGALEGLTLEEAHQQFGKESWDTWISLDPQNFDFAFPQGENTHQVLLRFTQTLKEFCKSQDFTQAGVCTHGLVLRRFLHSLRPELTEPLPIPNCVVYRVKWHEALDSFEFNIEN